MGSKNNKNTDQHIYRWSFEAVVSDNNQQTKAFAIPGMTLGSRKDGREAAENLEGQIKGEMEQGTITVRVRPVMHERISHELVVEYHRIGTKARVFQEVAQRFAHRLKFANQDLRTSEQILNEEIQNIVGIKPKATPLELIPTYKETDPEDNQPRMRLGIAAVNDILSAPAEAASE